MFCTKRKCSNIVNIFKGEKVWVFIHYGKNDFQYEEQGLLSTCKSSGDTDPIDLPKESARKQASYNREGSRDINMRAGREQAMSMQLPTEQG